ncbi:ABC transporter ATP-binding protein [Roseomonas sp. CECT 9278]|uniref:ABC transporter ATP-binding protein n=1 Tax=Roseomonas sp. CECT 9278 TaxID=2845823 RepID=UPI001E4F66EC|nr:ABC transporter ATP-binding protein [Roseomonas sp. CECT 9278]CAH0161432.1 Vitamin B12 import ATP-binding protein BtuD [Roseomonas sp. CECT 9278]
MPEVALENLTRRYGAQLVVDRVNLLVAEGEFLCLLGPSGCGKTTTLQMVAGFVEPTLGTVRLAGRDVSQVPPARRGLGVVFQSYALFPHMSVAENVAFGLAMRRVPRAEAASRVADALAMVRLSGMEQRYPRQLSGGQQQRVALARALVIRPQALLLDEPLSNLDAKLRDEMQLELRRIHRDAGITAIMVTHDQGEAMALADRIAIMNAGVIEQVGPPEAVYDQPATAFVAGFLGRTNLLDAAMLRGIAPAGTAPRWSLRPERLRITAPGEGQLAGRVSTRVFQGSQTLYELDTPLGALFCVQGAGSGGASEGQAVGIAFDAADLRPLAA